MIAAGLDPTDVLDTVDRCPTAARCDWCGSEDDIAVSTYRTLVGCGCRSLCWPCEASAPVGKLGSLSPHEALRAAQAHAEHLRLDLDEVCELVLAEARGRR